MIFIKYVKFRIGLFRRLQTTSMSPPMIYQTLFIRFKLIELLVEPLEVSEQRDKLILLITQSIIKWIMTTEEAKELIPITNR